MRIVFTATALLANVPPPNIRGHTTCEYFCFDLIIGGTANQITTWQLASSSGELTEQGEGVKSKFALKRTCLQGLGGSAYG